MSASDSVVDRGAGFWGDDSLFADLIDQASVQGTPFRGREVQYLIDRGRLGYAKAVLEARAEPAAQAMLADMEWRAGHAAAAMARCRRQAELHPEDFEALDRLGRMAFSICDMETAQWAISAAVDRGLRHRDHILRHGVESAWLIGRFDESERLLSFVINEGLRDSLTQSLKLVREAQERLDPAFLDPAATNSVEACRALIAQGKVVDGTTIIRNRILVGAPFQETLVLGRIAHDLGPPNWQLYFWASLTGALRFPDDPAAILSRAVLFMKAGDIDEGIRLLSGIVGIEGSQAVDIVTLLTFGRAAGLNVDEPMLRRALSVAEPRGAEQTKIALPWLDATGKPKMARGAPRPVDALDSVRRAMPPVRGRRPRLAVCISGQLRSFRNTWTTTARALEDWEPVIFVDTWNNVGAGLGAHDTVDRMLPHPLIQALGHDVRNRTKFESLFPTLYRSMMTFDKTDADKIREYCPVEHIRVHSEEDFDAAHENIQGIKHLGKLNQAKMFAMIANGDEQKNRYELETGRVFDAVLRIRPDRALHVLSPDDVETASSRRVVLTDGYLPIGLGDQIFLTSSALSTMIASIWPNMRDAGTPAFFDGASGRLQEFLLGEYVLANRVNIGRLNGSHAAPLSSPVLPLETIWSDAADDFLAGAGDDLRRGFAAINEACLRQNGFAPPAEKAAVVRERLG